MSNIKGILNKCILCSGVSIDSRRTKPGEFFVALRGKSNGNQFVADAFKNGAEYALIDDPNYQINDRCLLVDNALVTLQEMATLHRKQLSNVPLIVVAGSNGKTTTKELIHAVLSKKYNAIKTPHNLNNHIGVPLSILGLKKETGIAVIEIGANHPGEHLNLCNISQPNMAIVTNCGKDHLEGYGSIQGVIDANAEVYRYIDEHRGVAVVNGGDQTLMGLSDGLNRIIFGHHPKSDVSASILDHYPTLALEVRAAHSTWQQHTHLYGQCHAHNILAAISIGRHFGVDDTAISSAIASYKPSNNRSQRITWNGNDIFLDAYNANPSSMMAMLDFFDALPSHKKIVILGGMKELGAASEAEHAAVLERLSTMTIAHVFLIGKEYEGSGHAINCMQFDTAHTLKRHLGSQSFSGFHILVKGSRGYALETLFA